MVADTTNVTFTKEMCLVVANTLGLNVGLVLPTVHKQVRLEIDRYNIISKSFFVLALKLSFGYQRMFR